MDFVFFNTCFSHFQDYGEYNMDRLKPHPLKFHHKKKINGTKIRNKKIAVVEKNS